MSTRRWLASVAVTGITAALVPMALLPAPAQAADITVTPAERAAAMVTPALVEIETTFEGYVRNRATGDMVDPQSIAVELRCTGFGVSSDGYLATAGQCVDPTTVTMKFYEQIAARRVSRGELAADQSQVLLDDLLLNGVVSGAAVDTPPQRTVTVRREVTPGDPLPATVVSVAAPVAGDMALLKIEKTNQPLIALANPSDIAPGQQVVTVEFQAGAGAADGDPTARVGSIATTAPALVANAGPTDPLPGAPVLTLDGDVVGVLSRHQPTAGSDVLASVAVIQPELEKYKVINELAPVDTNFREGLDAYHDGRYTDAIERFDAVLAIIPSHQQAHDYRQQAQALREAQGGGRHAENGTFGSVRGWLGGAAAPLAAAALVVMLALVLVRRRSHHGKEPAEEGAAVDGRAAGAPASAPAEATATAPLAEGRTKLDTPTYCTNCSNALPPGATACPLCGHPAR